MNNPIIYNGQEYPVRYLDINGAAISVESLMNAFERDLNGDATREAEKLDNDICGYVPDNEINLPDAELVAKCREYGIID